MPATKKLTYEEVESVFEQAGYTLLSDRYINAHGALDYICSTGHDGHATYANFSKGKRCKQCNNQKARERLQFTLQEIQELIAAKGHKLLSDRYVNAHTKLRIECPSGHQCDRTYANFSKFDCPICSKTNKPFDLSEAIAIFDGSGYELKSQPTATTKEIFVVCPMGHDWKVTPSRFRDGRRCKQCRHIEAQKPETQAKKRKPKRVKTKVTIHLAKEMVECAGYRMLSTAYENKDAHLQVICKNGHEIGISWAAFRTGTRCRYCAGRHQTEEDRVAAIIKIRVRSRIAKFVRRTKDFDTGWERSVKSRAIAKKIVEKFGANIDLEMNIDHIVPCSYFDLRNEKEVEMCWHPDNLRLLPASVNMSRGNRLTIAEFNEFTPQQIEILKAASRKPERWEAIISGTTIAQTA